MSTLPIHAISSPNQEDIIMGIFIVFLILILVFFIGREIMCWYWKINERIGLQKETNNLLKEVLSELQSKEKKIEENVVSSTVETPFDTTSL